MFFGRLVIFNMADEFIYWGEVTKLSSLYLLFSSICRIIFSLRKRTESVYIDILEEIYIQNERWKHFKFRLS